MNQRLTDALRKLESQHQLNPLRQAILKQELLENLNAGPKQLPKTAVFFSYKMSFSLAAIVVAIIIAGGTAYATENSLPGDLLHPVKLAAEKIEIKFAATAESKAELEAKHTSERINEVRDLNFKAETETSLEHKTKIEELQRTAELETETRLEKTLDNLEQVRERLNEDGHSQAAASISISIERLKSRAVESRIKINRKSEEQRNEEIKPELKTEEIKIDSKLEIRSSDESEDNELEDSFK